MTFDVQPLRFEWEFQLLTVHIEGLARRLWQEGYFVVLLDD
jgi:dienelactone hydrolase